MGARKGGILLEGFRLDLESIPLNRQQPLDTLANLLDVSSQLGHQIRPLLELSTLYSLN